MKEGDEVEKKLFMCVEDCYVGQEAWYRGHVYETLPHDPRYGAHFRVLHDGETDNYGVSSPAQFLISEKMEEEDDRLAKFRIIV